MVRRFWTKQSVLNWRNWSSTGCQTNIYRKEEKTFLKHSVFLYLYNLVLSLIIILYLIFRIQITRSTFHSLCSWFPVLSSSAVLPRQSEEPSQVCETCCERMRSSRVIPSALLSVTLLHLVSVSSAIKCFTCNEEKNITCPGWDRSEQINYKY